MIKSTALLTLALFFTVAPSPDPQTWSEMTGGFLKANNGVEVAAAEAKPAAETSPAFQYAYVDIKPTFKVNTGF